MLDSFVSSVDSRWVNPEVSSHLPPIDERIQQAVLEVLEEFPFSVTPEEGQLLEKALILVMKGMYASSYKEIAAIEDLEEQYKQINRYAR